MISYSRIPMWCFKNLIVYLTEIQRIIFNEHFTNGTDLYDFEPEITVGFVRGVRLRNCKNTTTFILPYHH